MFEITYHPQDLLQNNLKKNEIGLLCTKPNDYKHYQPS